MLSKEKRRALELKIIKQITAQHGNLLETEWGADCYSMKLAIPLDWPCGYSNGRFFGAGRRRLLTKCFFAKLQIGCEDIFRKSNG